MKSIHRRLLIMLISFIIVPYFISVLLIYWHTKANVEQHELKASQEQMKKTSDDLERYFQDFTTLPNTLYRNPDLFRVFQKGLENSLFMNQREIDKGMKTFYLMRSEIRQVRIYIAKGNDAFIVYNTMVSARKRQPHLMNQASIQNLLNSKSNFLIEAPHPIENYLGSAIIPQSDKSTVLTIHHRIVDVLSDEFLGIVTIDIDLDQVARICSHVTKDANESVFLTDASGHIIYSSDREQIGQILNSDVQQKVAGDVVLSKTLSGALENWHLVKITSSSSLFREVRQTAYTNIIVGICMVLLGLVMISIISYKITRPIKLLSRKVQSVEGGNMNVPFDGTGNDELGYLERHINDMMNRINHHIEREYLLEIENKKNQFRALKSQINPHFLYNALQTIGASAIISNSPEVYRLVNAFSNMMRYSIRTDQWTTIRNEVDYVKAYLILQKERFSRELHSIDIDESILDSQVPFMILQPLVENFFKHCYGEGFYESQLRIYGTLHNNLIILVVENDGPGLSSEELSLLRKNVYAVGANGSSSYDHIGLKNIHERLILNYGSKAGIELDSEHGQGFTVRLKIPQQLKEELQQ